MDHKALLAMKPYSLRDAEKRVAYAGWMSELTAYHRERCEPYRRLLDGLGASASFDSVEETPMLPVGLFKDFKLSSVDESDEFKTMTSSGTTGQRVSRVVLDKETADHQQRALAAIGSSFWGDDRMPFLIIDTPDVLRDARMFSARGAGIMGFSIFASRMRYALDSNMDLDMDSIDAFIEKCAGRRALLFSFTFIVWKHFILELEKRGIKLDLAGSILVHGGGWKKMTDIAVSPDVFRDRVMRATGASSVHSYYGMAEQTGSIYMECEHGYLHASVFSDVITRRGRDLSPCDIGERGVIQVLSPLAKSYPGHSILTEDEGAILGIDDCPCGRLGKRFAVYGRIPRAETRGCSDTYGG